jgi:hypothetical protein
VDWDEVLSADDRSANYRHDRRMKNESRTESSKYFNVELDDTVASDIAWERVLDDIRHTTAPDNDDVYKFCKNAAQELDLSEHDFNELRGAVEEYVKKHGERFNVKEAKAPTVKAFKIEIPQGLTDSAIWDFINDQSVVTIEDFERKGNIVYLYPHFEHDHDPHMGAVMQAAFNRYLKANHLD